MVNFEQIQVGVSNFFDNEILAKTSGFKQFTYGFMKGAFMDKIPKLIDSYKDNPMVKVLEVVDESNMVDIDKVYKWAKNSIKQSGQFVAAGIIFNESDIDKLYNYIVNTTV